MRRILNKYLGVFMFSFILFFLFSSCLAYKNNNQYNKHVKMMNEMYENSDDTPFPNENFLFLYKTLEETSTKNDVILSSASGITFTRKRNTLYALTAGHWCTEESSQDFEMFAGFMGYEDVNDAYRAIKYKVDYYGKSYNIELIDIDVENDLCLFKFKSAYAKQAKEIPIASNYPNIGDKIYSIGAPFSISDPKIRLHFEGSFAGCPDKLVECYYTIPGTFGSSGSGVLNKSGELIGILTISVRDFNTVTGGSKLEAIKSIINRNL